MKFKVGLLTVGLTLFTAMTVTIVMLRSPPALASRIRRLGGEVRLLEYPSAPRWLRPIERVFGPFKRFHSIVYIKIESDDLTDEHLREIADCSGLMHLLVNSDSISDDGLRSLQNHKTLSGLHLTGRQITDRGADIVRVLELSMFSVESDRITGEFLEHGDCPGLVSLGLSSRKFTDERVAALVKLTDLSELSLRGSPVSDESIEEIASIQHLGWIDVSETQISEEGVAALEKARPSVTVIQHD